MTADVRAVATLDAGSTAHAERTDWLAVVIAYAAGIYAAACAARVGPLLASVRSDVGFTLVEAGWYASLVNLMTASLAVAVGLVALRFGYWRLSALGLVLLAVGGVAGAGAVGAIPLFLARAIESVGYVAVVVTCPGVIARAAVAADRPRALAYWGLHITLGTAIGVAAGGVFAAPGGDWRMAWSAFGLVGLATLAGLLALAWRIALEDGARAHASPTFARIRAPLGQMGPWLVGIALVTQGMQVSTLMVWLPGFLHDTVALSRSSAALVTAGLFIIAATGSLAGGYMTRRNQGRGVILAFSFPVAGASLALLLGLDTTLEARLLAGVTGGFALGVTATVTTSAAVRYARSPDEVGVLQGVLSQGAQLGMLLGPPTAALVVTLAGDWSAARWLVAACATCGTLLALVLRLDDRRTDARTRVVSHGSEGGRR